METKNNQGFLEKVFHLSENHTDVKTEVIAGITTFMTMAYILAVNPNILSDAGMDRGVRVPGHGGCDPGVEVALAAGGRPLKAPDRSGSVLPWNQGRRSLLRKGGKL